MKIADLAGALRRRWYVFVVGLVATLGLAAAVSMVVPAQYDAKAMLVLLPPRTSVPVGKNPYLNLGSMQPVSGVLSNALMGEQDSQAVERMSATATYTVTPDPSTGGSVVIIEVKDRSAATAERVMGFLATEARTKLKALQEVTDTPANGYITAGTVTQDAKATVSHKSQLRAVLLATVLGIVLSMLAVAFIDGRADRRRKLPSPPSDGIRKSAGDNAVRTSRRTLDLDEQAVGPRR